MAIKKPLFSIIIPTYNSQKTLSVALDSIINQTFKNLEVLIIDGLSTDGTIEIVEKYKQRFNAIRSFSEKDKGIYDAMNKGITLANGEWLFFMGSDDFFYEGTTLEQVINNERINDKSVVYGNVYSERFNGVYDGEFNYAKITKKNICHQSVFFRKSIFKQLGDFNLKYKSHADWDHNMRWFFSTKVKSLYIDQIIANYADNGFSSLNDDEIFKADKFFRLLILGWDKVPLNQLIVNCNDSISFFKKERKYFKLIILYGFKFTFKVLNNFRRRV